MERSSYQPLCEYLSGLELLAVDVSEGTKCPFQLLYDSDVYTISKGLNFTTNYLRSVGKASIFIDTIRGKTYIVILRSDCADQVYYHKSHVLVAIEVKTVAGLNNDGACFREAVIQLIGLNASNTSTSPIVILTNLVMKHYVFYLSMGENPEVQLSFKLHIQKCESFSVALSVAMVLSRREPFSMHFGRMPTPPPSTTSGEHGTDDS